MEFVGSGKRKKACNNRVCWETTRTVQLKGEVDRRKGEYKNLMEILSYRDKVPQYMYIC